MQAEKKARLMWESSASFIAWDHFRQEKDEERDRTADNASVQIRQQERKLPP